MPSEYTVKSGDTLWGIAKKQHVSLQELKKANPQIKRPDQILPGDKVVIPDHQLGNKEVGGDSEKCEKTSCIKIILTHEDGYLYLGEPCQIKQEKTLIWEGKLDEKVFY